MKVGERLHTFSPYSIEGGLDKFIEFLCDYKKKFEKTHCNLVINTYIIHNYGDEEIRFDICGQREETKKEIKHRESIESMQGKINLEYKKKQFAALQKELETLGEI